MNGDLSRRCLAQPAGLARWRCCWHASEARAGLAWQRYSRSRVLGLHAAALLATDEPPPALGEGACARCSALRFSRLDPGPISPLLLHPHCRGLCPERRARPWSRRAPALAPHTRRGLGELLGTVFESIVTAISATIRSTGRGRGCSGSRARLDDLRLALGACAAWRRRRASRPSRDPSHHPCPAPSCRGSSSSRAGPASTCSPPSTVMSTCPPRISPNDIALSNVHAPGSAVTGRPPASVSAGCASPPRGSVRCRSAVLGLEEHCDARRHVVRHERRDADAEIDEHAGSQVRARCAWQ